MISLDKRVTFRINWISDSEMRHTSGSKDAVNLEGTNYGADSNRAPG